jgi:hypothetical protein
MRMKTRRRKRKVKRSLIKKMNLMMKMRKSLIST